MTDQEIIDQTNSVFEEYFEIEKENLHHQAHLFEDLGLDSLDILDMIVALQQNFGVRMRDEEKIRSIRTLGDVYQFIINERDKHQRDSSIIPDVKKVTTPNDSG